MLFTNKHKTAVAKIKGGKGCPEICGTVRFKEMCGGVLVTAEVRGLPTCGNEIFAFHIHSGNCCGENFEGTLGHFNPGDSRHPCHAGDLPPLFGNCGYACMSVFTNRFSVCDIIGRAVVIHANDDDFTTQPSGNSGTKIACGEIVPC